MVRNPLFGSENGNEAEVKKALFEKLYNLLKPTDEGVQSSNKDQDRHHPQKHTAEEKSDEIEVIEHREPKQHQQHADRHHKHHHHQHERKKEEHHHHHNHHKETSKHRLEFADARESIETKMLTRHAELRPFVDLLKMEMGGGTLDFLGNRIILRDLESIVHKVISKLNDAKPTDKPDKSRLPQPTEYQKAKFKIKNCAVKLRDAKHKKTYAKALEAYEKDAPARLRRRRETLLRSLKLVAHKRKDPYSSSKRRAVSSDDSDDEGHSSKKAKLKHEDVNSFGSFK